MLNWLTPLLLGIAHSCTQVIVPAPSGEKVVANTIESGDFVATHGGKFVRPTLQGEVLGSTTSKCGNFTAKFGFVGGMNEKGLVVAHHMLKLSVYEERAPGANGICARDVDEYILSSFATVQDLIADLDSINRVRIVADPPGLPGLGATPTTLAWGVVDASGHSVVIEFVKGNVRVHNNTVGVLTNDPTWEWHVANLNNYAALQHSWYQQNNDGIQMPVCDKGYCDSWYPWQTNAYDSNSPVVPSPIGHGFNLLGLPGDGGGASRFVRVFFARAYALYTNPPRDLEGALVLAQELLNSVYKVKGTIASIDAADPLETTTLATLSIPATREVYHRGRADMTWRKIDLKQVDFSPNAKKRHARVASARFYAIDVTSFLTEDHPPGFDVV